MANTTKTSTKKTPTPIRKKTESKKTAKKPESKKPESKKPEQAKKKEETRGGLQDHVIQLRDMLSRTYPDFPSVDKLQTVAPKMNKSQLLMYIGMAKRTLESVQRVGRLAK